MIGRLSMSLPLAQLRSRLAPFKRTIGTTGGLVLATAINSATGFIFWLFAARLFPESAVGLAGAAVSAMLLLSQMSVLGLGTTLAGVLHREPRAGSLAVTALLAAGGVGSILGLLFAVASPALSEELAPIGADPVVVLVFAAGVGLTALSAVFDQVLVAVLRSSYQLLRNVVFSFGRLGLIVLVAAFAVAPQGMIVYGAWVAATAGSLVVLAVLPRHTRQIREIRPLEWGRLSGMAFSALSHHVLNLSRSSSIWLLPILVTAILSREANAAFYMALLIANFIALVGTSATFTLYVVGARTPDQLWRQMRFTMGISTAAALSGTLVVAVAGEPILRIFGASYAAAAFPTIIVLAASTIPLVIKDHWIALQRLRGSVGGAAGIGVITLGAELVAAVVGAVMAGLLGLAIARLIILMLQAVFMAPLVFRALAPGFDISGGQADRRPDGVRP